MTSASVESWSSSFNSKNLIFQFTANYSAILEKISTINESVRIEWDTDSFEQKHAILKYLKTKQNSLVSLQIKTVQRHRNF